MFRFIKKLAQLPYVDEIWLYGSRARQDNMQRSDIDIAILCPRATEEEWSEIINRVHQADVLLKIDCVRFDQLEDGRFKNNILKDKKVLYSKEGNFMDKKVWKDSFEYLGDAIKRLQEVLNQKDINTSTFLRDSTIHRFEFVIELYWKVLKKCLAYEKIEAITPRDIMEKAFQSGLINDQKIWLAMLDDRNATSHTYDEDKAVIIFEHIKRYEPFLVKTYELLQDRFYRKIE